jgi:hypothetical protein
MSYFNYGYIIIFLSQLREGFWRFPLMDLYPIPCPQKDILRILYSLQKIFEIISFETLWRYTYPR